jgi:hypothetical protein
VVAGKLAIFLAKGRTYVANIRVFVSSTPYISLKATSVTSLQAINRFLYKRSCLIKDLRVQGILSKLCTKSNY